MNDRIWEIFLMRKSLLFLTKSERLGDSTQTQTFKELVNTKTPKQTAHKPTQTKSIKQTTDKSQNSTEQQANSSDDLEQRLSKKRPQGVQLLLCVWHVLDALSAVIDRLDNGLSDLLE